ncbi:hypothetical protein WDV93_07235 [Pantoea ananatis]
MSAENFGLKRFVFSRFVGALCDQFLLFAVPLAILKATGSLTLSSLAFVIEWLPRIIFFPLSGFMADRIKPRFIFFNVDALRALLMGAVFALLYWYPGSTFPGPGRDDGFVVCSLCTQLCGHGCPLASSFVQ